VIRALASFALLLVLLPSLVFADRESREARDVEGFNRTREIVQIAAQSSLIDATNITQIANTAVASSSATTAFTYDVLNRLLSASTTAATSTPYREQYEYDTLGSIMSLRSGTASSSYAYANTSYANPHAVTQMANGVSTTTYSYDTNGNLAQKVTDGVTSTYLWDYANRLTALGVNNSTTTYGYDAFGARMYQIASTTATTTYASKWYSIASSTRSGTNYATTTEYVFNGDTLLLSTIDQAFTNSTATGTVIRYIHPDHLGSTNIVSNANNTSVAQALDYYPFGGIRINSKFASADSDRKYVNRFADQSNLDYLNARYYDPNRGQFVTQDPTFWSSRQKLNDPQSLNSYSYAENNPITKIDPDGLAATVAQQIKVLQAQIRILQGIVNLYKAGAAQQANTAFGAYQAAFGGGTGGSSTGEGKTKPAEDGGRGIFSNGGSTRVPNITAPLNSLMSAHASDPSIANPFYFKEKVKDKGDWDLKYTDEYDSEKYKNGFIYAGQRVGSDAPGNIHYGYVGAVPWWSSPDVLLGHAGENQVEGRRSLPEWQNPYFRGDDPVDQVNILWGIWLYYDE